MSSGICYAVFFKIHLYIVSRAAFWGIVTVGITGCAHDEKTVKLMVLIIDSIYVLCRRRCLYMCGEG